MPIRLPTSEEEAHAGVLARHRPPAAAHQPHRRRHPRPQRPRLRHPHLLPGARVSVREHAHHHGLGLRGRRGAVPGDHAGARGRSRQDGADPPPQPGAHRGAAGAGGRAGQGGEGAQGVGGEQGEREGGGGRAAGAEGGAGGGGGEPEGRVRLRPGLLFQARLPHRLRPAQRRDLRLRPPRRLHLRPHLPRGEQQHHSPPGGVLDGGARDGLRHPGG
mmetsp:Transcript_26762/g.58273  ORF Transcript_26762/g.58273 Transcript_26762/m.58273 type:complete len:217 (-) Transcript_26762:866-1516(-)